MEQQRTQPGVVVEVRGQQVDLTERNAAVQVCPDVVRFRRRGVIDVAADVEVEFLPLQFLDRHFPGVFCYAQPVAVDVGDLLDVFGPQRVLVLAFLVFPVGVDEEHAPTLGRIVLVDDQHAGRNARAVEQTGRQADDRFEVAILDELLAARLFFSTPEQDAVRHDHGHAAIALERGDHVLHEHQVGLLAALGHEGVEPLGELHPVASVVLREGRIGDHPVEAADFALLVEMLRLLDRVALANVGTADAVQEHVHLADGPGAAVEFLSGQFQVAGITTCLLHVLLRLDEHTARPGTRIVDAHAFLRFDQLDHHANDFGRRVELATLFARTVGEVFDEVFVGRTEQIGELEVVVGEGDVVEVLDERHQGVVIHRPLADLAIEVDPLEHVLQRVGVGVLDGGQGLVQPGADRGLQVGDARVAALFVLGTPAGIERHEEVVLVGIVELLFDQGGLEALALVLSGELVPVGGELIAQPFEEQHAEDVFLVLRGVHVASQDVAGLKELPLQPGQRQLRPPLDRCHRSTTIGP